ncbi:hypothetical protein BC938DRAFT_470834 [Jimgerdemannia flammicorona]|uniref:Uncharacterized protein n=1 Tax=Jimgerdemannia flammicorona TaxID=994334 RepID=A0A433QUY3_9FUNG|nr:hypothetical protein BC938DRAFT_470834 [Jimgerdemannia flammicorona]
MHAASTRSALTPLRAAATVRAVVCVMFNVQHLGSRKWGKLVAKKRGGDPEKKYGIVAFTKAFHGRSLGSARAEVCHRAVQRRHTEINIQ